MSTDPLSGYNPVSETEHYIDGQHNSGVFNSFNHNTYGYCYQNPVKYIDPDGKDIIIGSKRDEKWHFKTEEYKYVGGKVYNRKSSNGKDFGSWNEYKGELDSDMQYIVNTLDKLSSNSQGKAELIDFFEKEGNNVGILIQKEGAEEGTVARGSNIYLMKDGSNIEGEGELKEKSEPFIDLAHEMAHVKSLLEGKQDTGTWYSVSGHNVAVDEINSTHVENKVRVASGMKLRRAYVGSGGRILDDTRKSIYIDKNESYPNNRPVKINPKERFDYGTIKRDE